MHLRRATGFVIWSLLLLQAAAAGTPSSYWSPATIPDTSQVYTYRQSNRDGIGKVYLGREISRVMGHQGAAWLERPTRQAEEQPDLLVRNLPLEPTDVVADIGAGTGYFAFRISPLVPQGKCLAVDIQPEMLAVIRRRMEERGVTNVVPVLGSITDPNLPEAGVDLVMMVDTYHEFSHRREMAAVGLRWRETRDILPQQHFMIFVKP